MKVPLLEVYRPRTSAPPRCLDTEAPRQAASARGCTRGPLSAPCTPSSARGTPCASRGWVYVPLEPRPLQHPPFEWQIEQLSLEECCDFVAQLQLPAELGPKLYAELEAENGLLAEGEANSPDDLEWLVSHFGPKVDTRFLLYWPQMVPALRRCVDFGFEGAHGAAPHPSQPSKPKRPQTPGSARVLRESPVHASETLTSAMAEELRETAPVPRSEWGFERRHGPKHSVATARRPPSRWGFERSHGPVDAHRFERRTKSGPTSGTSSLFTGGFSPSFHSTRMALALGAIEGGELPEEPFLYMESGGGLFARTLDVRRLPGGYRPFLPCTDFDEYDLHVKEFKEALRLQRVRRNLHGRLGKFAQSAPASRRLGRGPGERSRRRVSQVGW